MRMTESPAQTPNQGFCLVMRLNPHSPAPSLPRRLRRAWCRHADALAVVAPPLVPHRAAGGLDDLFDVGAQLGHGVAQLLGQDVAEGAVGELLAAQQLVVAADELDELARVDFGV